MNLLLRPLDNPDDPVWSVIILVMLSVVGALFVIIYILRMAFDELNYDTATSTGKFKSSPSVANGLDGGNPVHTNTDLPVLVEETNRPELREETSEDINL